VSPQVLWPHLAESGLRIIPVAISVSMALGGLFFIEYMQLRGVRSLTMKLSIAGLCLQCLVAVAGLFVDYHAAILSSLGAAGIYCAYGVLYSLLLALSGNVPAQRYFVSWLPLLLGVIVQSLAAADVLPLNVYTENVTLVGSALQSLLLSLALADRMRTMKDEKEAALRQMMQQEKMASLGMLSAGVAHEINNPNSFIRVGIGNLSAKVDDLKSFIEESLEEDAVDVREIFREKFASIESQAGIVREGTQRIDAIVKGMRAGSRADGDQAALFNPVAALRATVDLVQPTWKTVAQFDVSGLQAEAGVMGFASQLNQVFTNFLVNACHAIEDRQRLRPGHERGQVTLTSRLEGGELVIAIADNGCGMSAAVQQRLFQPFFTTKSGERGTGLGMGICKKIVEGHGGRIEVASREGAGTTMSIVLPVHASG
jgi:signal transduction histidine kinase